MRFQIAENLLQKLMIIILILSVYLINLLSRKFGVMKNIAADYFIVVQILIKERLI